MPYHHSNIQSEEVMFYAEGDYAARKGVEIGSITLHPSGLPHGPQPGAVERALGAARTDELAVMWDTFSPLAADDRLARQRPARVRVFMESETSMGADTLPPEVGETVAAAHANRAGAATVSGRPG